MENKILYYYNIYVSNLEKDNNNYSFIYNNNNYRLELFNRPLDDLNGLYDLNKEMISNNYMVHRIIPALDNLFILIDNKPYVLLQLINISNRRINIDDILSYNYVINNKYSKLNKSNWSNLWENKIDYIEYQFSQMNKKYPLISESINYYLGIWENAISYFNNKPFINSRLFVCHHRISVNDTLNDFYNPLKFIIDYKERDIGGYLKSSIVNKKSIEFSHYLNYFNPYLIVSRLLFPNYYFDLYEAIISGKTSEKEIEKIISLIPDYEMFLKRVFLCYKGIIPINWIIKKELNN